MTKSTFKKLASISVMNAEVGFTAYEETGRMLHQLIEAGFEAEVCIPAGSDLHTMITFTKNKMRLTVWSPQKVSTWDLSNLDSLDTIFGPDALQKGVQYVLQATASKAA